MKINYNAIDYKRLYQEEYKRLPKTYYVITLATVIAGGLLEVLIFSDLFSDGYVGLFSFLVGSADYISGILAVLIWLAIAIGAASLVRYLSAIGLSQKVVVADTLLDMQGGRPLGAAVPTAKTSAPFPAGATRASLDRIAKLKEQGVLTEEEAAKMRADLLSGN